jgi:hypothetical protein
VAGSLRRLAWSAAGAVAAINVLGYALSLYELAWFDEVLHVFTLFAVTLALAALMRGAMPGVWRPMSLRRGALCARHRARRTLGARRVAI